MVLRYIGRSEEVQNGTVRSKRTGRRGKEEGGRENWGRQTGR